jgi:hypothetical protein
MDDSNVKKINMELPNIEIGYGPSRDVDGNIMKTKEGDTVYYLKITGFKDFKFNQQSYDEYGEIKNSYKDKAKKTKLTKQDLSIFKLHLELWARENINNGGIVRYVGE